MQRFLCSMVMAFVGLANVGFGADLYLVRVPSPALGANQTKPVIATSGKNTFTCGTGQKWVIEDDCLMLVVEKDGDKPRFSAKTNGKKAILSIPGYPKESTDEVILWTDGNLAAIYSSPDDKLSVNLHQKPTEAEQEAYDTVCEKLGIKKKELKACSVFAIEKP